MDKEHLEDLLHSFKLDNFRKIYVDILKFFNFFEDSIANEDIVIQFLNILRLKILIVNRE